MKSSHPTFSNFFVMNDEYGNKEGREHERIFFFHPSETPLQEKTNVVGLAQALIGFIQNFSDHPAEFLSTEKKRQYYFSPEPHFHIGLTMSVPVLTEAQGDIAAKYDHGKMADKVYGSVLKQAYKSFIFFHGTFTHILESQGLEKLKAKLNFFGDHFAAFDFSDCDILTIFEGIKFLPLDKDTYLRVQSFAASLEHELVDSGSSGLSISTMFMYMDFLIWSSLDQGDTQILYEHVVKKVYPECVKQDLLAKSGLSNSVAGKFVGPLYGPNEVYNPAGADRCRADSIADDVGCVKIVYLTNSTSEKLTGHYLVIYRSRNLCVCMLVRKHRDETEEAMSYPLDMEFFWKVHFHLGPRLSVLSDEIKNFTEKNQQIQAIAANQSAFQVSSGGPLVCYIYFNRMNLATKATFSDKQSKASVADSLILQLADIQEDLQNMGDGDSFAERLVLSVKNKQDLWMYGRRCRERELYLVLNNKQSTLKDVYETVENLCRDEFANIFFQ